MHTARRLLGLAIAQCLAGEAAAQDPAAVPAGERVAQLEEVVVVGSRIRRVDVETSQPVFVLEQEQLLRTGLASVGDILQDLTVHGAALNTTVNNGGDGRTLVDLRNLGPNRTLVLVNGRRWNSGLDGGVDLNSIPLSIVERIEVLKDGASAIYGSDAIAGVVNITTKSGFVGAQARAWLGEYDAGDGRMESYDFTLGAASDRADVAFNVAYVKQEPVYAGDREISAVPIYGLPPNDGRAGASQSSPDGRYSFGPAGNCAYDPAGVYPGGPGCNGRGGRPPTTRNRYDPATGAYPVANPLTDGYNFAPENYLQTPQERTSLYAQGRYQLTETIAASTEAFYNQRESSQLLAPSPFTLSTNFGPPFNLVVPADHVYNPFGQPVSFISLRPGGQSRRFSQDVDTLRIGGGLTGELALFDRSYAWDLNAVYASQEQAALSGGQLSGTRLAQALGPSFRDAAGTPRCGTPAAPIEGCVPFDAFHGAEAFTPDMLSYLYFVAQDQTQLELWDYSANLTGDLVDLWAGPLAFAAGYEYRRNYGEFTPDALLLSGGSLSGGAVGASSGLTTVDEFYAEFTLPLLVDRPGAEVFEVNAAMRYSDYNTFGETTNFKGGLRWKPVADLLLRGNYAEGFRAPTLDELYAPISEFIGDTASEPCVAGNEPTSVAGCIADGVPGGSYEPERFVYSAIDGGNAALQPETATDKSLGVVWSPRGIAGLDIALDWYRIEIENAITRTNSDFLLQTCVLQQVPEACARTARDPATGELLLVDARALNSGTLEVEGYDLTVRYAFDTRAGRFSLLWDNAYYAEYLVEVPRGAPPLSVPGNYFTFEPGWRLRSNLDFTWQRGDWEATLGTRYYPGLDEGCFLNPVYRSECSSPEVQSPVYFGAPENRIDARWYFDLQGAWSTPWNGQVRAGVQNLFDEDPPVSYSAFANSFDPQYPIPGRFWYLSYTQSF